VLAPAPRATAVKVPDLRDPGLIYLLRDAIARLHPDDHAFRMALIKEGASNKAHYAGLDQQTGFLIFEWPKGHPLILVSPSICPMI
jgi:hypothetical protein